MPELILDHIPAELLVPGITLTDNSVRPEDGPQLEDDGGPLNPHPAPDTESAGTAAALVNLADSFLGYHEGSDNDNRFSAALGRNHEAWCQDFDCWLALHLGYKHLDDGWTVTHVLTARKNGTWHDGTAGISKADSIYFHWPESSRPDDWPDHVGIVRGVFADGSIDTVEGNHDDQVARCRRRANILGYIRHDFDAGQGDPAPPRYRVWFVTTNANARPVTVEANTLGIHEVLSARFRVGAAERVAWICEAPFPQASELVKWMVGRKFGTKAQPFYAPAVGPHAPTLEAARDTIVKIGHL